MQQKTLNEVEIPLHKIAREILVIQTNKSIDDKLFHIPTGGKTTNHLRQWMLNANIKKHITFHCARHSYAMLHLDEMDTDIYTLSKLLGHAEIKTTQIYVHVSTKEIAKIKSPISGMKIRGNT